MFDQEINRKPQEVFVFYLKTTVCIFFIEAQQSFSPRISFKLDSYRL